MSLKEWIAAVNGYMDSQGATTEEKPLTRTNLKELMEQYPDVRNTT